MNRTRPSRCSSRTTSMQPPGRRIQSVCRPIQAVKRQQIDISSPRYCMRVLEGLAKLLRRLPGRDLGLHNQAFPRQFRQHPPQLHLARPVAARRLDMMDAKLQSAVNCRLQIGLSLLRYLLGRHILPLELIAHSPARKHRHRNLRAPKPTISHRSTFPLQGCKRTPDKRLSPLSRC